jgi:hypothetical protein
LSSKLSLRRKSFCRSFLIASQQSNRARANLQPRFSDYQVALRIGCGNSSSLLGPRASRPQTRCQARSSVNINIEPPVKVFALRAHCGRDARGPSKELDL